MDGGLGTGGRDLWALGRGQGLDNGKGKTHGTARHGSPEDGNVATGRMGRRRAVPSARAQPEANQTLLDQLTFSTSPVEAGAGPSLWQSINSQPGHLPLAPSRMRPPEAPGDAGPDFGAGAGADGGDFRSRRVGSLLEALGWAELEAASRPGFR